MENPDTITYIFLDIPVHHKQQKQVRFIWRDRNIQIKQVATVAIAVLYSLTETEIETEMFCKTETKYKRKSENIKRNSNWN